MLYPHLRHQILQEIILVIHSKYHRAKLRIGRDSTGRNAIQSSNWLWRVAPLNFISQPFLTIWIAVLRIALPAYAVRKHVEGRNMRGRIMRNALKIVFPAAKESVLALLTKWL